MTSQTTTRIRRVLLALPWMLGGLAASGCFGDGPMSTIRPESDSTQIIQNVYALVTWIDVGILIVVGGMLLVAMVRYHEKRRTDVEIPKQVHGNTLVEIIWTVVPAVLLIFIAVPTWQGIFRAANPPREEGIIIEAIGHQWWWEFRYPDLGITTANEMHIPVGKPIVVKTYSKDVIHSFWLPRLAAKIDTLPGKINEIWFTPNNTGKYYGQCAEFCGTSHANMRMFAIVDTEADFEAWVERQRLPPDPTTPDAREGMTLFMQKACMACHKIEGMPGAVGIIGPQLNDLANRTSIASAMFENTPENLSRWIQHPQEMKPGALMILPLEVNAQEAAKIAAFLNSPPSSAPGVDPGAMMPSDSMEGEGMAGSEMDSGMDSGGEAMTNTGEGTESGMDSGNEAMTTAGLDPVVLMQSKGCGACHIIPGVPGAVGVIGPSLEGLMNRDTIAAGAIANTPDNLRQWLKDPPSMKPGTLMLNLGLSDEEVETLMLFLNKMN